MNGIVFDPGTTRPHGVKRAWSYLKPLRSESLGIPTLFWDNHVCASDVSKAEALRAQYDSVFTHEYLTGVPALSGSPFPDVTDTIFSVAGIRKQLQSIQSDKAC